MKIYLIYFHGWGFDDYFWSKLYQKFLENFHLCFDQNYFNKNPKENFLNLNDKIQKLNSEKCVVICHSYGLARFIRCLSKNPHLHKNIIGVVSIAGFLKFIKSKSNPFGIDDFILRRMIKKFDQKPLEVLKDFYHQCEFNDSYYLKSLTTNHALGDDLKDLATVDEEKNKINFPTLILNAVNDRIVSSNVAHSLDKIFINSEIITRKDGGHALGFNHADWCARKIKQFIKGLDHAE